MMISGVSKWNYVEAQPAHTLMHLHMRMETDGPARCGCECRRTCDGDCDKKTHGRGSCWALARGEAGLMDGRMDIRGEMMHEFAVTAEL